MGILHLFSLSLFYHGVDRKIGYFSALVSLPRPDESAVFGTLGRNSRETETLALTFLRKARLIHEVGHDIFSLDFSLFFEQLQPMPEKISVC